MIFSSGYDKLAYYLAKRDGISIETALCHVRNFANDRGLSPEGVAEKMLMPIEQAKLTSDEVDTFISKNDVPSPSSVEDLESIKPVHTTQVEQGEQHSIDTEAYSPISIIRKKKKLHGTRSAD